MHSGQRNQHGKRNPEDAVGWHTTLCATERCLHSMGSWQKQYVMGRAKKKDLEHSLYGKALLRHTRRSCDPCVMVVHHRRSRRGCTEVAPGRAWLSGTSLSSV